MLYIVRVVRLIYVRAKYVRNNGAILYLSLIKGKILKVQGSL